MTRNKTLLILGMAVATMAGCGGGQTEPAAAQASAPQAVAARAAAPASAADTADTSAAQAAMSGALKSAIAMHAQTSVPALACDLETEASLEASKTEIRKLARAEGIDDAAFDHVYAAAERKTRARWDAAPAAKRSGACQEWKTMTAEAQAWADSQ